jgi:PAS domain S-box-containing protein
MSEKGHILIVDDSEFIRTVLCRDLGRLGYRCTSAADGHEALENLRAIEFDVALIDLMMPGMDGLGLLKAMREEDIDTVPIILSGHAQVHQAVEATKRGAFDLIEKPAAIEVIGRTVDRALRHRRVLQEAGRMAGLAEQWEDTFDAFPDMIVVVHPDGRIHRANQAVADHVGRRKEDLAGQACHEALCGSEHAPEDCPFVPGRNGRFWVFRHEGLGGHFELSSVPLRDQTDKTWGTMHVIRDLTARRVAERKLREAHAQNELVVASISSILICLDEQGRITQWNETAERTFGIAADQVLGSQLPPCGVAWEGLRVHEALTRCEASGQPVRVDDIRCQRADGTDGFIAISVNPMKAPHAEASGMLILGMDITDRRILEGQLAQAQKLEGIGQLAAGIAHEINTPMQYVGDNIRFLEDSFRDLFALLNQYGQLYEAAEQGPLRLEDLEEVTRAAGEIDLDYLAREIPRAVQQSLEGVLRVTKIVRAMRDFSHPGAEAKTAVDINKAIENTITICRNEWKYVSNMETDYDTDLPPVPCLPGKLNQVILNLIVNAAHAIENVVGDGANGKGTIQITTRRCGDWAEIRVCDTGSGIPDQARDKIFDPFFTTKEVGKGTGQGLAIARSLIVDKHNGTISFESQAGEGTSFLVRLPLLEVPPTQDAVTEDQPHGRTNETALCG